MNILVTGGAGYIGSHAVQRLKAAGAAVSVVDNLFRGHRAAVAARDVPFHEVDLRDTEALVKILTDAAIDGVMHFGALAYVGESVDEPLHYYANNTSGSISLLQAMDRAGVNRIVFSSTCATYGEPTRVPIVETEKQLPINPYGWSKLFVELPLLDHAAARPRFSFAALRYFNVAGSARDASIGEDHEPETHLIPVLLLTALGKREKITIFGDDYDTPDGTCVRDYIHVEDLADAHVAAMNALGPGRGLFYNLGIGHGHSVREVIDAAVRVTGVDLPVEIGPRRPGDPPMLYADPRKIKAELGWEAKLTEIDQMVGTAWEWFRKNPGGYAD